MTPAQFRYQAVSFDVDGTLYSLNHFKVHVALRSPMDIGRWQAMERARRQLRAAQELHEDVDAVIAASMATDLGIPVATASAVAQRLVHDKWPELLRRITPYRLIPGTLEALTHAGVQIVAASDYPPARKLEALKLGTYPWTAMLDAGDLGALKPRPEVYQAIIDSTGLAPHEILHVGDSAQLDVAGAQAVGIHTALVGTEARKTDQWEAQPNWAFPSVNEFCKVIRAALAARSTT